MKISHYGSLNGTPLELLDTLLPRKRKHQAKIMVSTKRNVYSTINPVPDELLPPTPEPSPIELGSFISFESGQVKPLAISPDGNKLYVLNTPDNRLEIFNIDYQGISPSTSVFVGMESVAVAVRNNGSGN